MTSWLRVLGLRIAFVGALVATVLALRISVAKPDLPFALFDSFDRAFALAYDAAERKVVELEARNPPAPPRRDVFAILRELEGLILGACDTASTRLDIELAVAGSLSAERRHAVLGCIERHLREARNALRGEADPVVRAEYHTTCERLRAVRQMV